MTTENTQVAATETATSTRGGRVRTFENQGKLLAALTSIRAQDAENMPSRNLSLQLVEMGLVEVKKEKIGEGVGAPRHTFVLSAEGEARITVLEREAHKANVANAEAALKAAKAEVKAIEKSLKVAEKSVTEAEKALEAAKETAKAARARPARQAAPETASEAIQEVVAEVDPVVEAIAEIAEAHAAKFNAAIAETAEA